jgi:hypothetical protein
MSFKIFEPVDAVPVVRTDLAPIWDAVHKAEGKWLPVSMETKERADCLSNNVKARNTRAEARGGRYEARQRGATIYIRFEKALRPAHPVES